jgi:hypothetical protein
MKVTAWALLIFMGFFTVLTFILALTNPVTDCGCFGDAIILTNWETFFKNLIFMVPTIIVFHQREKFEGLFKPRVGWTLVGLLALLPILLSVHCLRNLPLIDFRPYHVGANIPEGMEIPEGMPTDEYQTVLIYEKDGQTQEFTLDSPESPWNDSTWTWVETKNILVKEGYHPPIHDFTLVSPSGIDITNQVLYDEGYSFLLVAYDLEKSGKEALQRMDAFAQQAVINGFSVYGMTATIPETVQKIRNAYHLTTDFYTTDEITLKTMVRSNPGLILLKEGTILAKWHHRNIPDTSFFEQQALANSITALQASRSDFLSISVVLFFGLMGVIVNFFKLER